MQWLPNASMSVDAVMRGTIEDAWEFWASDPKMPDLGQIDAAPGDVSCNGTLADAGNSASYCNGAIRWDAESLRAEGVAMVPANIRHWAVVITAAHETGHHFEGSILADRTYQQHEDIAECLAGTYMMHRHSATLSPEDMGLAYAALGRDDVTPGNARSEAFFDGLRIPRVTTPRDAFKACVSEWG